jgi:hypothetical protein
MYSPFLAHFSPFVPVCLPTSLPSSMDHPTRPHPLRTSNSTRRLPHSRPSHQCLCLARQQMIHLLSSHLLRPPNQHLSTIRPRGQPSNLNLPSSQPGTLLQSLRRLLQRAFKMTTEMRMAGATLRLLSLQQQARRRASRLRCQQPN